MNSDLPDQPSAVEPVDGAGLTPDDPPQDDLTQDPNVPVTGDVDQVPDDQEL